MTKKVAGKAATPQRLDMHSGVKLFMHFGILSIICNPYNAKLSLWLIFTIPSLIAISVGQPDKCRYPCAPRNWNSKRILSDIGTFHATTVSRTPGALYWHHNKRHSVSNYRRLPCLLNRLFSRSKEISKLHDTGFCEGIYRWPGISPNNEPERRFMTS